MGVRTLARSDDQHVDGVEYTPEAVESIREMLTGLRDAALSNQRFDYAVGISHALVYLSHYRDSLGAINRAFVDIEAVQRPYPAEGE